MGDDGFLEDVAPDLVDLRDKLSRLAGGPGVAVSKATGCCMMCSRAVNPDTDFDAEIERAEWRISHLCKACQDVVFAGDDD